jgi:MFS family permease
MIEDPSKPLLNEAPKLTPLHYWIVFLCWGGWIFDFYDLILYSFLLIPIGAEFHFSKQQLAWVYSLTLLMTGAGGILFGMLSDRFGRKPVLQWTVICYCVGTFLCGFTQSFWWLFAWRAVTGLGIGGEWGVGHTLISETFPAQKRGRFGAVMQSGAAMGVGLAAIMGGFFAPHFGWRTTFLVSSLPAALVVLVRRKLPESDVWLRHREGKDIQPFPRLFAELFNARFLRITLLAFALTCFNMCSYWFTYSWFPGYLKEDKALTLGQSGALTLVIVAGELLGYTTFGLFSDRIGRRKSFTIFAWLMCVGLTSISLAWKFFYSYPVLLIFFLVITGIGTGTWSNFGPMFSELYPTRIRNTALNTLLNMARATQFITPILITTLSVHYGLVVGLWLGAFFAFLAGLWIWLLPETKGRLIAAVS